MDWNWLQSILFGLISGPAEILPVSSEAHQALFALVTGAGDEMNGFRTICRISTLLALLMSCWPRLVKFRKETRIAAIPAKKRKRQPDIRSLLDMRICRMAVIPVVISFLLYLPVKKIGDSFWVIAAFLALNGVMIYIQQFLSQGNKDPETMSALDALLIGIGGALGVLPGISRVGGVLAAGRMRGAAGEYALELALLLSIPAIVVLSCFDVYLLVTVPGALRLAWTAYYLLAAVAAFAGAYFSVLMMRFLSVKIGYSGFAYYCWGVALLSFILYLSI